MSHKVSRSEFPGTVTIGIFMVCNSLDRRQWQSRIEAKWLGTIPDIIDIYILQSEIAVVVSLILFRGSSCVAPSPVCSVAKQPCSRALMTLS